MAITNSGSVRPGAATRPTRRKAAAGRSADRFVPDGGGLTALEAAPQPAAIAALCSLLSMQEASSEPAPVARRAQALHRGHDLLDRLDDLHRAIVAGPVVVRRLDDLARSLAAERTATGDADLDALLGEIELRAAVEVAKLDRRQSPQGSPADVENGRLSHVLSKV